MQWSWVNLQYRGGDGGVVLGKLPVPGRPTNLITLGQGPIGLPVGAGGMVWTFLLSSILSLFSPPLRYRLKYCLQGPFNPKQPTNQSSAGASYSLDDSRARTYCACNRSGWGLFRHFYSSLLFHPLSGRRPDID